MESFWSFDQLDVVPNSMLRRCLFIKLTSLPAVYLHVYCNNGNTCVKGPCMLESLRTALSYKSVFFGALSGSIVRTSIGQYARRSRGRF